MTAISPSAAAAREQARQGDGKFGTYEHGAQDVDLDYVTCDGCGRPSEDCSYEPCDDVIADRGNTRCQKCDGEVAEGEHGGYTHMRGPGVDDQMENDHVAVPYATCGQCGQMTQNCECDEGSCRTCGAPTHDGEGFDGLCGNCADVEEMTRCPACGEPSDHCSGHDEIGDPAGAAITAAHESGNHSRCHADAELACDAADYRDEPAETEVLLDGGGKGRIVEEDGGLVADRWDARTQEFYRVGTYSTLGQAQSALARAEQRLDRSGRYGDVSNVKEGSRTPWGQADVVTDVAPGIVVADTPGHGGLKLSPERNKEIPAALRRSSGWYEEDCESRIVQAYHPEAFSHLHGGDHDLIRADGIAGVKQWFPHEYEQATGNKVALSESVVLQREAAAADAAAFRAANSSKFVGLDGHHSKTNNHAPWIPDGYVSVKARMDDTGEERHYLVPKTEAISDHQFLNNVVVDPSRHTDVTSVEAIRFQREKPTPPVIRGDAIRVKLDDLTDTQRARVERDLNRRFRYPDGSVKTPLEDLQQKGVIGKKTYWMSGEKSRSYYVDLPGGYIQKVSKASYDALDIPDLTTDTDRLRHEVNSFDARIERARRNMDFAGVRRLEREAADVRDRLTEIDTEDQEKARAASNEWRARQQLEMERIIAERGLEF